MIPQGRSLLLLLRGFPSLIWSSISPPAQLHNISLDQIKVLLAKFIDLDIEREGTVRREQLARVLGLRAEDSEYLSSIFNLLDLNNDDKIDFREFVIGVSALSENVLQ